MSKSSKQRDSERRRKSVTNAKFYNTMGPLLEHQILNGYISIGLNFWAAKMEKHGNPTKVNSFFCGKSKSDRKSGV